MQMICNIQSSSQPVVIPGFHLTSDENECWGEAALFRAATKRLNEGVYCGVWSDPDRSPLSGLLPLSRRRRRHSFLWLSLTESESKLWAQTWAARKVLLHVEDGEVEVKVTSTCCTFCFSGVISVCRTVQSRVDHKVYEALKVPHIHVTECVCWDFLLHVWQRWFLSGSRQLRVLRACVRVCVSVLTLINNKIMIEQTSLSPL